MYRRFVLEGLERDVVANAARISVSSPWSCFERRGLNNVKGLSYWYARGLAGYYYTRRGRREHCDIPRKTDVKCQVFKFDPKPNMRCPREGSAYGIARYLNHTSDPSISSLKI